MLPAACGELSAEYPLAFFKEAIILVAVNFQQSAISLTSILSPCAMGKAIN